MTQNATMPALLEQTRDRLNELTQRMESARQTAHRLIAQLQELSDSAALAQLDRIIDSRFANAKAQNTQAATFFGSIFPDFKVSAVTQDMGARWQQIQRDAHAVANHVDASVDRVGEHWRGPAADKYASRVVSAQVKAAQRVGEIAKQTSAAVADISEAAAVFMAGVQSAYYYYIGYCFLAIATAMTAAGLIPALAMIGHAVEMLYADLKRVLDAYVARQARQATVLYGLAISPEGFGRTASGQRPSRARTTTPSRRRWTTTIPSGS
jgi:hypothetical protein